MKIWKLFFVLALPGISGLAAKGKTDPVRQQIGKVVEGRKATVGVAFISDGGLFTFNDAQRYPLMSVFKFHVAFAALEKMESERTNLEDTLHVVASQLHEDTYSPLRDIHPDRDFYLSFGELIRFCVSESDNNACDILIDYVGGIRNVNKRVAALGLADYSLSETEAAMHADITDCYNNWSTPSSMVKLLHSVYDEKLLGEPYDAFFKQVMIGTTTGKDKIKGGLPAGIVCGHKTGSSDRLGDGTKIGDNDAGVIYLPDGRKCFIAVFIKDSRETDRTNARMIADITKVIYRYLSASSSGVNGLKIRRAALRTGVRSGRAEPLPSGMSL